ncbi:MAG: hypothetical protein R3E86_05725 [Pseudomonadales bacterium]
MIPTAAAGIKLDWFPGGALSSGNRQSRSSILQGPASAAVQLTMGLNRFLGHLLCAAMLVVPAICCGEQHVPQAQRQAAVDMVTEAAHGGCVGHARSAAAQTTHAMGPHHEARGGCMGCALLAAASNPDGDRSLLDLPDLPALAPVPVAPVVAADLRGGMLSWRPGPPGHRPSDTPVTRFDRQILPG